MVEKEKRFKIQKKISYEEQLSIEEKKATMFTITLGLVALLMSISGSIEMDIYKTTFSAINGVVASFNLKLLVEAITKKTILENEIRNINDELKIAEIKEESREIRR